MFLTGQAQSDSGSETCNGVESAIDCRTNEKPMDPEMPVIATLMERAGLASGVLNEVAKSPVWHVRSSQNQVKPRETCLKNDKY